MTGSLLLRSQKAQTDALNEALDALGTAVEDPEALAQEIRWLIEDCVRMAGRLKAAFDTAQRRSAPRIVDDIHADFTELLGLVDAQLRLGARVRDRALGAAETSGEYYDLKPLDEAMQSLIKLKEHIVGLCEWLSSPPPASSEPLSSAAERRAAFERGEYESVEDVFNRVRQGGPLVKE